MNRMALTALLACFASAAFATSPAEPKADAAVAGDAAATTGGQLTYEIFEAAVDHADLAECPAELAAEGRFCRISLHKDMLHVFAFSEEGDQPLEAVKQYPLDIIKFSD